MKAIAEVHAILDAAPTRIGIIMHQKPDADAMGSSLGLAAFFKKLGHTVTVVSPTNWAQYLSWMPGARDVLDYEKHTPKTEAALKECNWIFCLDFNHFGRTKRMVNFLPTLDCHKALIDHHEEPQVEAFEYGISNPGKSSTAEMVYDYILESGKSDLLDAGIASCLYAGVMTDTGSFRFPATTASVHAMVAGLMKTGFNHSQIHDNIYDNYLENRLRFIGHVLTNRMEIFYQYNTVLISVPYEDLVKYQIKTGDTEGIVNLPQSISGIKMVAIIVERNKGEIKLSFRSKGNVDVNTFARKYFEGGGHFHAAGGSSASSLRQTNERFIRAMKESKDSLQ
jgi:bifunctional oligoribonuclease and PAP phosphatase NrnA